jgi:peptide/nickel transport system permease protein
MEIDYSQKNYIYFFTRGWEYKFLGLNLDIHLFTTKDNSKIFLLGSDAYGRDMLSRVFKGSRVTLLFALIVVSITTVIGILVGISSGYFAGKFDIATQRITELALAFPELPLYLSLVAILPRQMDPFLVFIFMAFILSSLKWAQLSREVRGKTLSLRRLDYIKAAEALGSNDMRIIVKHLLPNVTSHVIVSVSLLIPSVILTESFFSFLGLGIQSPFVSWGLQLNSAQDLRTIGSYPWVLSPVFAILISVLGFNAFGDALRDAIDPYATTTKK